MYQIRREARPNSMGLDDSVYVLIDATSGSRAEVWPALGFNCYRWVVQEPGLTVNALYADPQLFDGGRPTRSGIPVLFPFPNRIRDGRFNWQGKEYRLPPNDPAKKNAIHGFTAFRPWRVVDQGADGQGAWLTGEFHGSVDAAECSTSWPADYRLRLTYRLQRKTLRLEAAVSNPDQAPLPFGLGYHPYFRVPLVAGASSDDCLVQAQAWQYWELRDNLPTGARFPVLEGQDLRTPRPFPALKLDDVLTDLPDEGEQRFCGQVSQTSAGVAVKLRASASFRELVVFTPPHREAVCIEPYTCVTDAINLHALGIDAGLLVLEPGQTWNGDVELKVEGS